jgi:hypothetical protein
MWYSADYMLMTNLRESQERNFYIIPHLDSSRVKGMLRKDLGPTGRE